MAHASGSIAAARGKNTVGDSWWMLCLCSYDCGAEGAVGDEEDGLKWAAREERRFSAEDILMSQRTEILIAFKRKSSYPS